MKLNEPRQMLESEGSDPVPNLYGYIYAKDFLCPDRTISTPPHISSQAKNLPDPEIRAINT